MKTLDLEVYPFIETNIPHINNASVLYRLDPLGLGSEDVESLTSYITRLAYAHNLYVTTLLYHLIKPYFSEKYSDYINVYNYGTYKVNGNGDLAIETVRILENLTGYKDLSSLTLVSFSSLISNVSLMEHHKSWCPICYEEMKMNSKPIYDKLIWTFKDYKYCFKHHLKLFKKCQNCNAVQKELSRKSRIGFCQYCHVWLGQNFMKKQNNNYNTTDENRELHVSSNIESLILHRKTKTYSSENLSKALSIIKDNYFRIPKASFCKKELGMNFNAYTSYIYMEKKPILESLIRISLMFNVSLKEILSNEFIVEDKVHPIIIPPTKILENKEIDLDKIRKYLEDYLQLRKELKPLHKLADDLQYSYVTIRKYFPDLCNKINLINQLERRKLSAELRKERIEIMRQVVRDLKRNGIKPTYRAVQKALPYSFVSADKELMDVWRNACSIQIEYK